MRTPAPYYSRAGITLYLGDAREVLPTLERHAAALIVTDPPYGVDYQSNRGQNFERIAGDDGSLDVPAALDLAAATLRPRRHAYIFGRFELAPPFRSPVELIWDKVINGSGDLTAPFGPSHEVITFVVRSTNRGEKQASDGSTPARLRQGSVLSYPRPNAGAVTRHPTEKPVALLRRLIESSSLPGELVLDPFAGVGSTLVAAVAEGRRAIGIELDAGYAATAADRLDRAIDGAAAFDAALR